MSEYNIDDITSLDSHCSLDLFFVNSVELYEGDFVDNYDHAPEEEEFYGCGDMLADILSTSGDVLKKYNITEEEYDEIAKKISEVLSFGRCSLCN